MGEGRRRRRIPPPPARHEEAASPLGWGGGLSPHSPPPFLCLAVCGGKAELVRGHCGGRGGGSLHWGWGGGSASVSWRGGGRSLGNA